MFDRRKFDGLSDSLSLARARGDKWSERGFQLEVERIARAYPTILGVWVENPRVSRQYLLIDPRTGEIMRGSHDRPIAASTPIPDMVADRPVPRLQKSIPSGFTKREIRVRSATRVRFDTIYNLSDDFSGNEPLKTMSPRIVLVKAQDLYLFNLPDDTLALKPPAERRQFLDMAPHAFAVHIVKDLKDAVNGLSKVKSFLLSDATNRTVSRISQYVNVARLSAITVGLPPMAGIPEFGSELPPAFAEYPADAREGLAQLGRIATRFSADLLDVVIRPVSDSVQVSLAPRPGVENWRLDLDGRSVLEFNWTFPSIETVPFEFPEIVSEILEETFPYPIDTLESDPWLRPLTELGFAARVELYGCIPGMDFIKALAALGKGDDVQTVVLHAIMMIKAPRELHKVTNILGLVPKILSKAKDLGISGPLVKYMVELMERIIIRKFTQWVEERVVAESNHTISVHEKASRE